MNTFQEVRALMMLSQLQENEVMSRSLREMAIRKHPWYKRPFYRFRFARSFRKAWKEQLAQNYKRIAELNTKPAAEPEPLEHVFDVSAN